MDVEGTIHENIRLSRSMRIMAVPVQGHNRCYGILALLTKDGEKQPSFSQMDLLHQLLNVTAIAMENAYMFIELEERQKELRFLTEKLITLQEEERRQLAADIHDNLYQALTGMGYRIQVCRELINRNPKLLAEQLDNLTRIVDDATRQSRRVDVQPASRSAGRHRSRGRSQEIHGTLFAGYEYQDQDISAQTYPAASGDQKYACSGLSRRRCRMSTNMPIRRRRSSGSRKQKISFV